MKSMIRWFERYVEGVLAAPAQGHMGFMGLAKEATWGTAVAATDYAELMSENLTGTFDRFEYKNVIANFAEPDDAAGVHRIAGSTVLAAQPVALGHFLKAAMNTVSGSVVLSGFLWTVKFISTKSEFVAGQVPTQPYTLEVHRDVTSSHQYKGCLLDKLELALAPNQDLRVNASWIGQDEGLIAKTTPTFPASSAAPFTFDTASVSLAGAGTARIEALNISVDNQLEGHPALNNSATIIRVTRRGPQMVRVSGTLDFTDVTEQLDFLNQTERALKLSLTKSQSFQFTVDIPKFVYTAYPLGIPGRGRLTVGFQGRARYSTTSALAVDFSLTTTKSNY